MGMFDEFHFHDPLRCAAGHEVRHVQTKDLASHMDHYHVFGGQVFLAEKSDEPAQSFHAIENGYLLHTTIERMPLARLRNGQVSVYSACHECDPIYTESDSLYREQLIAHYPWCCWVVTVEDDRIVKVDNERVESREDVRKKLQKQGSVVLPDDDRAVQRALARRRQER